MEWFVDNAVLRVMMPIINISAYVLAITFLSLSFFISNPFSISWSCPERWLSLNHFVPYRYQSRPYPVYSTTSLNTTLRRCSSPWRSHVYVGCINSM